MNVVSAGILAVAALSSLWAVLAPRDKALPRAMSITIVLFVLIPTFGPSRAVSAVPVILSIALLGIAMVRQDTRRLHARNVLWTVIFVAFHASTQIFNDSLLSLGLIGAQALGLCLAAAAASRLAAMGSTAILTTIGVLVPLEALIALLEQMRAIPYVWARSLTATYTDIGFRNNEIASWLPGRSMGTFAHPILLGTFAAIAFVLCVVAFAGTRRWRWLLLAVVAAGTLSLSGTRSAAAGALVALTLWLVFRRGSLLGLRIGAGLILVLIAVNLDQLTSSLFNSEVRNSTSYIHRTRVLSSIPAILDRDGLTFLFGSGAGSVEDLFSSGIVQGSSGYMFFDNQYVRLIALSGIVGLTLFFIAAARGFRVGNEASRAALVVVLVLMASFDTLTWNFSALMSAIFLSGAVPIRKTTAPADSTQPQDSRAGRNLSVSPSSSPSLQERTAFG